ncbi:MAG: hypothetical protein IT427_00610, partial [Pirellulales bacterium]|nr:hypothetical protein [Pirellulales bacterium]
MNVINMARQFPVKRFFDRVLPVLFFASAALVFFIVGAYVAEFDIPWYQKVLQPSFRGIKALEEKYEIDRKKYGCDWTLAREAKTGIGVCRPELTYAGLTLYAPFGEPSTARLISMTGKEVHRWHLPFREIWPEPPHVPNPSREDRIHWHCVRLLPNGDLIANYVSAGGSPYGYGLAKIDKDSKLIWRFSDNAHHDFDIDESGKVYGLTHHIDLEPLKAAQHLPTPRLEDSIVVLSPDGQVLQRVAIFDAFIKSKFCHYLDSITSDKLGDPTHTNGIDVISPSFARHNSFCSPGDVMVSLRNPGILAIINLQREEVVWAARGMWKGQHDCDPLENGNIMLFDNRGNCGDGGTTRILEWNPRTGAIEWCYRGSREQFFESESRGGQQLLPNGNVLITESNNGRIFEVTRDGEIAWS